DQDGEGGVRHGPGRARRSGGGRHGGQRGVVGRHGGGGQEPLGRLAVQQVACRVRGDRAGGQASRNLRRRCGRGTAWVVEALRQRPLDRHLEQGRAFHGRDIGELVDDLTVSGEEVRHLPLGAQGDGLHGRVADQTQERVRVRWSLRIFSEGQVVAVERGPV